jgi:hypothetical protein
MLSTCADGCSANDLRRSDIDFGSRVDSISNGIPSSSAMVANLHELLLVRRLVNAEDRGDRLLYEGASHDFVREEHQLFDELVSLLRARVLVAPLHVDGRHPCLGVEHDLRLGQVEVERAALQALGTEHTRELVRDAEARRSARRLRARAEERS